MSLIHLRKLEVRCSKPIYCGQSILDVSKTLMYEFHYDYIKPKYGNLAKLLYTDTDSLVYHIKTDDFYEDTKDDVKRMFDTSNYSKDHPATQIGFPVGKNKKVLGMMKDECGGKQVLEFVGLRSKLYAIRMDGGKETKKAKGVKKTVVKQELKFEQYVECLQSDCRKDVKMRVIRSQDHKMFSEELTKTAQSANDDKRIILDNSVSTLAIGHWRVTKNYIIPESFPTPRNGTLAKLAFRALV